MAVFQLRWVRFRCGPLVGRSMVDAVRSFYQGGPRAVSIAIDWASNQFVLAGAAALLLGWALLARASALRLRADQNRLMVEFDRYRAEMQAKARAALSRERELPWRRGVCGTYRLSLRGVAGKRNQSAYPAPLRCTTYPNIHPIVLPHSTFYRWWSRATQC